MFPDFGRFMGSPTPQAQPDQGGLAQGISQAGQAIGRGLEKRGDRAFDRERQKQAHADRLAEIARAKELERDELTEQSARASLAAQVTYLGEQNDTFSTNYFNLIKEQSDLGTLSPESVALHLGNYKKALNAGVRIRGVIPEIFETDARTPEERKARREAISLQLKERQALLLDSSSSSLNSDGSMDLDRATVKGMGVGVIDGFVELMGQAAAVGMSKQKAVRVMRKAKERTLAFERDAGNRFHTMLNTRPGDAAGVWSAAQQTAKTVAGLNLTEAEVSRMDPLGMVRSILRAGGNQSGIALIDDAEKSIPKYPADMGAYLKSGVGAGSIEAAHKYMGTLGAVLGALESPDLQDTVELPHYDKETDSFSTRSVPVSSLVAGVKGKLNPALINAMQDKITQWDIWYDGLAFLNQKALGGHVTERLSELADILETTGMGPPSPGQEELLDAEDFNQAVAFLAMNHPEDREALEALRDRHRNFKEAFPERQSQKKLLDDMSHPNMPKEPVNAPTP
jgi:hypothetical protein